MYGEKKLNSNIVNLTGVTYFKLLVSVGTSSDAWAL